MTSRVKELKKQFDKGASPRKIVEKTLPSANECYLYGGKTLEAQQTSVPLVVVARPGAYQMVCNGEACYIRVPHNNPAMFDDKGSLGSDGDGAPNQSLKQQKKKKKGQNSDLAPYAPPSPHVPPSLQWSPPPPSNPSPGYYPTLPPPTSFSSRYYQDGSTPSRKNQEQHHPSYYY